MLSNLPLQVIVYFNGWYAFLYTAIMLAVYIWKGTSLPYPGQLGGLLALEICLIFLLAALEYARLLLMSRGNKTERASPLIFSLLLSFPSAYLYFYFLYQQVYVTRLDLIISATALGFIGFEMLISVLLILTLGTRAFALPLGAAREKSPRRSPSSRCATPLTRAQLACRQ